MKKILRKSYSTTNSVKEKKCTQAGSKGAFHMVSELEEDHLYSLMETIIEEPG